MAINLAKKCQYYLTLVKFMATSLMNKKNLPAKSTDQIKVWSKLAYLVMTKKVQFWKEQ